MLEAPSPSFGYLLATGLEAVQASCWNLAFIHRYYPARRDQGGGCPVRFIPAFFHEIWGGRDQACAGYRRLLCILRELQGGCTALLRDWVFCARIISAPPSPLKGRKTHPKARLKGETRASGEGL